MMRDKIYMALFLGCMLMAFLIGYRGFWLLLAWLGR